ncbi:MAG: hypothetical protein LBS50_05345, partial [Prevotellaceae bacterium]|nr:hypothetical protein [Prevotellaceae bacterium]
MKNIFYVFKARTLCTLAAILFFAGAANAVLSLTGLRWSINGGEYGTDPINAGDQVTFSVQVTNNQGSPYASCGGTDGIQGTNTTKWGIVWRIDATTGGCYAYHDAAHDTLPNGSSFWADVMGTCNGEHPAYWVATAGAHTIYVRGDGGCTPESSMPSVGFPITVTLNCNPIATTNYNGTVKDSPWATDVNIDWRNFDNGVEGCAYQRVAGQQGTFRSISNFFSSDDNQETKGYNATGWCRNGAWMGYTFEITTAGTYTFSSFGRKRNGQDNDRVNYKVYEVVGGVLGDQVGSTLYSANWGDSGDPHEVTSTSSMHLNAGVYQLRVQIDNNGDGDGDNSLTWSKINTVSIDAPCTLTPFAGNAPTNDPAGPYGVGTYVWAPYYDNGGQNCSFYNANTNAGEDHPRGIANEPETHDNNLKNAIGWTTEGDWMIYSITVAIAGQYDIMTEMAGWATSSNVKFDFYQSDGVTSAGIGQITLGGSTGGSGTYNAFTTASPITFAAGTYKVKVTIGNSVNFRGFQLQIPCTAPTITNVAGNSSCGAGSLTLSATASSGTAVINWYAAATGGSPLATGGTYSPSPSATTTYWVDAT